MAGGFMTKLKRWLKQPRNQQKVKRAARSAYRNYKTKRR